MNKPLAAALLGAILVTQAAFASDSFADAGRYQLIPKVLVPNQFGKDRAQPVLLDTETGRTWRLEQDSQEGKSRGLHWVPLDINFPDRLNSKDASLASAKKDKKRQAGNAVPKRYSTSQRLDEYEDDP